MLKSKYGIIKNGELEFHPKGAPGAKPVKWAPLPTFDQETQAVVHSHFTETPELITVHPKVVDLPPEEEGEEEIE